ncbi:MULTISPECIES: hypothetical protein [Photorhabdus]|uniref:Uncharacterized protein n=1 Tax=Photorhabdus bodei TaxID=2029681 RepID=A0AAW6BG91_9GAMM|nr:MULTISPECIES: hypothetical protein [Photorhabdus]MCC8465058.1 hypothetical protein [Photorhabdus bodei]MCT8351761.1 hypothetical protein [Photorhabdus kayaii]MDB6368917.1 hypothetical protein [Photorhabdus bodei]MDB6372113.1 hypothetical protein [Photorhabdus bodei]
MINKPIVYDFHGDKPLNTPFTDIKPQDIHIYLDEINDLVNKRLNGVLNNGCFSRELMNNLSSRSIEIKNV